MQCNFYPAGIRGNVFQKHKVSNTYWIKKLTQHNNAYKFNFIEMKIYHAYNAMISVE